MDSARRGYPVVELPMCVMRLAGLLDICLPRVQLRRFVECPFIAAPTRKARMLASSPDLSAQCGNEPLACPVLTNTQSAMQWRQCKQEPKSHSTKFPRALVG